jgi:hypothetical protein
VRLTKTLPLLGLLAALCLPATALAAEPGLNLNGGAASGTTEAYSTLTDTGARWARHFLYWDGISEAGLAQYDQIVAEEDRRGVKTLFVVTGLGGNPPANPQAYADYVGNLAKRWKGRLEAIEVWNEQDEGQFWRGAPQADRYTDLLQRSYTAIKAQDPRMTVVLGATTGNNYGFLEQVYGAGGKGSFDVAAAHTDTACLVDPPSRFYKDQGRIARFTFLGYRELRATMLAHGDDKPIWLTEIGWSAAQHTCEVGMWAGQKAAGVSEAAQAQHLLEAFHCLKQDPYVQVAMWFNNRDLVADGKMANMYGLLRADGSRRPAYSAFQDYARFGDRLTAPCGDFGAPTVQVLRPRTSAVIGNKEPLTIRATSPDKDVLRMTFAIKGAPAEIRNFTNKGQPLNLAKGVGMDWQGAKKLRYGTHTLVVTAVDAQGNAGTAEVSFRKVNPATLGAQRTAFPKLRLLGSGRKRTLAGQVRAKLPFSLPGKVVVEWHNKRGARWKKVHGAAYNANKPFRFTQRLRSAGRWRVRVRYVGKRPFRSTASRWIGFTVR